MALEKVYIIGGGPIGLLTGILLLKHGYEVDIYEEHDAIGFPQHCTGIVSRNTFKQYPINLYDIVINEYYGVNLKIGDVDIGSFRTTIPKAFVIDRVEFERRLAHNFINLGGKLNLSSRIKIRKNSMLERSTLIIDAGGTKSLLRSGYRDLLPAIQVDIQVRTEALDRKITRIVVDKDINPDYFMWVAPYSDTSCRIGTASKRDPGGKAKKLIEKEGIIGIRENVLTGLVVAGGPIKNFLEDGYVRVGDAAGMVKATTGGGLYYGAVGAHLLVEAIKEDSLEKFQKEWYARFGREIWLQKLVRKYFLNSSTEELLQLISILSKKEVFNILVASGDMDLHTTSLVKIILDKDLLKTMLHNRFPNFILRDVLREFRLD